MQAVSSDAGSETFTFAENGKYYVSTHSATLVPPIMSVCSAQGPETAKPASLQQQCYKIWEGRSVDEYGLVPPRQLELKAEDGTMLYGEITLPPNAAPDAKIPLIVHIYGGPFDQIVQNTWGRDTGAATNLFHQKLAREGFAIFAVDNRGTPNRGKKFSAVIRKQFGGMELKDQLAALDQLLAQYPQLDPARTGIWGWSNGGSMTLYALTHSNRFKAGIAVAPVTNWRDYDSIYTERWLGLPKENQAGYDDSIVSAAGDLKGSLLLVHGMADDNVHVQNTMQMTDALIKAGKQFRLMLYPSKTHGISGPGTRTQLFHMMEDFWNKELK